MNKQKIIMYLLVIVLVVIICFGFVKFFGFESNKEKNKTNDINEELVLKLYSYLIDVNASKVTSMYNGNYASYNSLSYNSILIMIYEYIKTYDDFELEATTIDELLNNSIIDIQDGVIPLYKIKIEEFEKVFKIIFGNGEKLNLIDFSYDINTFFKLDSNKTYYYVYTNNISEENSDVVFKEMLRYAVTDNNKTIKIYDYYLKCDVNNQNCYNDDKLSKLNNKVKYNSSININQYINDLVTYEHTFIYEDGYFHWKSSQVI